MGKIIAFIYKEESSEKMNYNFFFEKVYVFLKKSKISIASLSDRIEISEFRLQNFFKGVSLKEDEIVKVEKWFNNATV
jgi:hypothetical protein